MGLRLLIAMVLVGLVVWRQPRFVGASVILRDLRRLDKAIALEPRNGEAVSEATVELLESIERWEGLGESTLTSRMVRQSRGTQTSMLVGIARYNASRGRPERALDAYRKATTLNPDGVGAAVYLEFYTLATQQDPANGEARRQLARYLAITGQTDRASEVLLSALQNSVLWNLSDAWVADAHLHLGMLYEAEGDTDSALSHYHQALQLDARLIVAMARMAEIYAQNGEADQAQQWQRRLAELEPEYAVGQAVGNGWFLVGYDVDEQTLQDSTEVEIALYWLSASAPEASAPDWYRAGDRWVQVTTLPNLAPNGSFEQTDAGAEQLPSEWYVTKGSNAELPAQASVLREGGTTQVASLRGQGTVALCAVHYPRTSNSIYLHSAWVRSDGATAADVGCAWKAAGANAWTYIIRQAKHSVWTHYAGIEAYGVEATGCQPCVYKRGEGGEVQFDDVLLVRIELPGSGLER